jgi:hypothetical protein
MLAAVEIATFEFGSMGSLDEYPPEVRVTFAAFGSFFLPADSLLPAATPD